MPTTAANTTTSQIDRLAHALIKRMPVLPALVPGGCVDMRLLASFRDWMAVIGESVSLQRMRYDRRYAFDRLACGHGSSDPDLQQLSLRLFEVFQLEP